MEYHDYYQTLGVARNASQADIKKAYRKLARESHPDRHPGDKTAEQRFKDINEANAVLSDPAKRAKYDQFGRDWEAYTRAGAGQGAQSPFTGGQNPFAGFGGFRTASGSGPGGVRYEFRTSGDPGAFSDFFHMMFGDEGAAQGEPEAFTGSGDSIDEVLARMGLAGGGARGAGSARRGASGRPAAGRRSGQVHQPAPIEVTAEVSLEEAYHGTSRIVDLEGRRLEVTIPRGVGTGSRIRLTGKGPDGRDLVVVTALKPHPLFSRRGDDLEREVPVSLREALLGGEVPVGTLKGRVLLTLPPGTQNGRTFRLTGQGMPHLKGGGTGNLFVKIRVVLPTDLGGEARQAAERFLDLADQPDPRA
jgi:curved DNA-binding protein